MGLTTPDIFSRLSVLNKADSTIRRIGLIVALLSLSICTAAAQSTGARSAGASTATRDSVDLSERSRRALLEREFETALESASQAAEELGLPAPGFVYFHVDTLVPGSADVLLYRGLALELQRRFVEALADYRAVLAIEEDETRKEELRTRLPYVRAQAARMRARIFRDDSLITRSDSTLRKTVGVFPLYNASSILVMSQVAFGMTGVIHNALLLLDEYSDQQVSVLPYDELRWILDELLPQEVYRNQGDPPLDQLAAIANTEFLTAGELDEVVGSLTADIEAGAIRPERGFSLEQLQSSYSPTGLLNLQREMVLSLADSIQARTGFEYTPSREAFADSLETYLIDETGRLLDYGFALEQLLLGDAAEAGVLLLELADPIALRDTSAVAEILEAESPPADNIVELVGTEADRRRSATRELPTNTESDTTVRPTGEPPVARRQPAQRQRTAPSAADMNRTARLLMHTADHAWGDAAVREPLHGAAQFGPAMEDPRTGKPGVLDPTRRSTGVGVRVVVPLPSSPNQTNSEGR